MYRKILVGTDFSETATRAVDHAIEVAKAFGAELHVVTAYRSPLTAAAAPTGLEALSYGGVEHLEEAETQLRGEATSQLTAIAERAAAAGVHTEAHVKSGDAADVLIGLAEELGADLIVVGNRGLSGVKRFVLGSISSRVTHHAPCSVLVAHTTD